MNAQIKLSATQKKYLTIIESGKITEGELIALNSFYNKSSENKEFVNNLMYNNEHEELTLTDEQNKKGYEFLMSLRFTPSGKERLNNPYGYRRGKYIG